jgi:hypothetical protein
VAVVALAAAGWLLHRNLWRAVLVLWPTSLVTDADAPADQVRLPEPLGPLAADLERLGFVLLGSRTERPKLTRPTLTYDYAHRAEKVFATLYEGRGGRPRLYLTTPLAASGFVITANRRRAARQVPGHYLSGGLEDASAERLYHAHLRRLEGLTAQGEFTLEGRVAAARAWQAGPGRGEIRLHNVQGLLWTLGTLGMLAAALFGRR